MVVVCELSGGQELIPVILFVAREDMDELLELLVDTLRLAVSLQVVSSGGCRLYTNEVPQLPGELDELRTAVGDTLPGVPWCHQTFQ
jgi:hypothetical protein